VYQPKPSRSIFGVASMDLFASALGAFVILTIVSLPFFMNSNRSEESQPMVEQYNRLYNQNENLRQQLQQLQQQNERISINDLELLLLVDFSNSSSYSSRMNASPSMTLSCYCWLISLTPTPPFLMGWSMSCAPWPSSGTVAGKRSIFHCFSMATKIPVTLRYKPTWKCRVEMI